MSIGHQQYTCQRMWQLLLLQMRDIYAGNKEKAGKLNHIHTPLFVLVPTAVKIPRLMHQMMVMCYCKIYFNIYEFIVNIWYYVGNEDNSPMCNEGNVIILNIVFIFVQSPLVYIYSIR